MAIDTNDLSENKKRKDSFLKRFFQKETIELKEIIFEDAKTYERQLEKKGFISVHQTYTTDYGIGELRIRATHEVKGFSRMLKHHDDLKLEIVKGILSTIKEEHFETQEGRDYYHESMNTIKEMCSQEINRF